MDKGDSAAANKQQNVEKIISTAMSEFITKGIKAVKMDDIATILAMSKRTLYELFENKEQLLLECVKRMAQDEKDHLDRFTAGRQLNVIAIVIEFYRYQLNKLNVVSPQFYADMHKYQSVNNFLDELKREKQHFGLQFFAKGVDEGYFRKDVDYELISKVCSESMNYIYQNHLLDNFSLMRIFQDVTMLYIRGLCTLKGIETLEKILSEKPLSFAPLRPTLHIAQDL